MSNLKENLKFQLNQQKLSKRNKKLSAKKQSKWLYPIAIEKQYKKLLKSIMYRFIEITNKQIKSNAGIWKEQNNNITGDAWKKEIPEKLIENIIRGMKIDQGIYDPEKYYDSPTDDLEQINQEYIQLENQLYGSNNENLKSILTPIAISIIIFNDKQFQKVLKSGLGVESFFVREQWTQEFIKQWVTSNVNLITGMTNEYRKKINTAVIDAFQNNKTVSSLKKTLTDINYEFSTGKPTTIFRTKDGKIYRWKNEDVRKSIVIQEKIKELKKMEGTIQTRGNTQSRSELIARDQTSKLEGQVTKKRLQDLGLNLYIWRTVGDERVRLSHKVLDNKYCTWNDPTVYADILEDAKNGKWKKRSSIGGVELHPKQDFQCRCDGEAVFDDIIEEVNNE